nr:laminin subunit beta-4 [Nothobranchius furzeri]
MTPLFLLVLISVVKSQDPRDLQDHEEQCIGSSCHPRVGDLMIGRAAQLSASSTCGLKGPQNYCIIGYLEGQKKCFTCDSRLPYHRNNPNSHHIENIISTSDHTGRRKWWQSENGVHQVSIQLDLEAMFQFSHLVLTFKSFRPAAMLVEQSKDFGQSWKVIRYFAEDCAVHFPSVPDEPAWNIDNVVCDSRYSSPEPSTGGEVVLKALDPVFEIENPNAPEIQNLITLTNIRVNFTRLFTLGDTLLARRRRNPHVKYYYSLYNMVVQGRCFCNGHASRCVPEDRGRGDVFSQPDMVHGRCVCQHNTAGKNCERCQEFYNDSPWKPGGQYTSNTCKRCNCHGHSDSCHFDADRYAATSGVSGGVCDDCRHNKTGPQCELCRPFLYQNPQRAMDDPHACIPCDCDPAGSLGDGLCDASSGQCFCKEHVEGQRCDRCKQGFFNLRQDSPTGCQECECHSLGSVGSCDQWTGSCECMPLASGPHCDRCVAGFWGLGNSVFSCSPCECDIGGAHNNTCFPEDGQCHCLPNIVGQHCSDPAHGYFLPSLNYFLYEAEHATPMTGGNSIPPRASSSVSPLENPALPPCEQYFKDQGFNFKISNGKVTLVRRTHVNRLRRQHNMIPLEPGNALQIIPRQRLANKPEKWTGLGFVRVVDGAGLVFTVENLPASMEYQLVIHYEPESPSDWLATVHIITLLPGDRGCSDNPAGTKALSLPGNSRLSILDSGICLNTGGRYIVEILFQKKTTVGSLHILVDSMGLIPRIDSVQDFCSQRVLDSYHRFDCIGLAARPGSQDALPKVCEQLIKSLSARIHHGAIACRCNVIGSLRPACSKLGGFCECKPNVIGRCCDTCAPLTFGFGPEGCTRCECDPRGSVSEMCDQVRGQCACRSQIKGRRCDQCQSGLWGFPLCRLCDCNGLSEVCEELTGECVNCREHAAGPSCNRCEVGYYGNPVSGQSCQPCMCPDSLSSGRFFATSCQQDLKSSSVMCFCWEGHTGAHCDQCSPGFYGNLTLPGAHCQPCPCNNNIDPDDRDACDSLTGKCLHCLHNTRGPQCQHCILGYYGNALQSDCKECSCDRRGTEVGHCHQGRPCFCDPTTGQCPCRTRVVGVLCDECEDGSWDLSGALECQACRCDPANSISNICDKVTGQCPCHPGFGGRQCDKCGDSYFGNPDLQCLSCDCNLEGSEHPPCNPETGECLCRAGVAGISCDECAPGYESEFPSCKKCHPCTSLWIQNVTNAQKAAQRVKTFISHHGNNQHPPGSHYWQQMLAMYPKLDALANLTCLSLSKVENMEKLYLQIRKLKDAVDLTPILIDPSPLLHAEIGFLHLEFNKLLTKLKDKLLQEPNKKEKQRLKESDAEAMDEIRQLHQVFIADEKRIRNSNKVTMDSIDTRQEIKLKLSMCRNRGNLAALEQKVKELSEIKLNQKICGAPDLDDCSKCGGGHMRVGVVPHTQKTSKMADNIKEQLAKLPSFLQKFMKKITNAQLLAEGFKDQTSDLQYQITNNSMSLETEKIKTKEIIQQIRDYLMDEMVPSEDIVKMAKAVWTIQLPPSLVEVRSAIIDILNLNSNASKYQDHAKELQTKPETVQELLKKAHQLKKWTENVDVEDISRDISATDGAHNKANGNLKAASQVRDQSKDQIQDTENKLEHIEKKLMIHSEDLWRGLESMKNKTESSRELAREAKETADSAFNSANQTNLLDVMMQFELLKQKHLNRTLKVRAAEQLKEILNEAKDVQKQVEDGLQQVHDVEQKIQQLLQRKKQKAVEVAELLEMAELLQQEIASRAEEYTICSS